ncbi:MAG: hypothetical protein Q7V88_01680 [Actinomycetota bacterium]|nr:hypothetical protein [Actinomycetota bacterium]
MSHSSTIGAPHGQPHSPARSRSMSGRRVAGAAAVVGAVALLLVTPGGAVVASGPAASPATGPAASRASAVAAARLVVVAQTFNLEAAGTLQAVVRLPGGLRLAQFPDAIMVVTAYSRLTARGEVAAALDGDMPRSIDSVDLPVAQLEQPAAEQLELSVPLEVDTRTAPALQLPRAGLYPVVVELVDQGEVRAEVVTFVHRLPTAEEDAEAPLSIAFAMSTSSPVVLDDAMGVAIDDATLAELTQLADLLEAAPQTVPVAVRVPSALLAALATQGAAGAALAQRLDTVLARHNLVSTPSLPLDPSAAAAAGEQALYTQWLRDGEDVLAEAVATPSLRTLAFVDEPLSQAGGDLLRDLGARLLVLPHSIYDGLGGSLGWLTDSSQLVQIEVADGVTIDCVVIDRFASATLAKPTSNATLTAIYAVADLLAAREQMVDTGSDVRRHGITIAMPELQLPAVATFGAISTLIAGTPGLRPTTLDDIGVLADQLVVEEEELVVTLPPEVDGDITPRTALAESLGLESLSTGSMLPGSDPRTGEWNELIDHLPTSALTDAQVADIAAELRAQWLAIRNSVAVPPGFSFNLTGRRTTVPIKLHNTSDITLTVRVRMSSSKLLFPNGDITVELPPDAYTDVPILIEARSNGRFPVTLEVFTPIGDAPLAAPVPLTASVNALSGLGILITGALALVLLTWWVRHVRQNRRARAAGAAAGRHPVAKARGAGPGRAPGAADGETAEAVAETGETHSETHSETGGTDRWPGAADGEAAEAPDDTGLSPDAATSTLPPS